MTYEYWYVFPISILFATTAMASGVEGATFFSPLFILALKLSPEVAIGTALIASAGHFMKFVQLGGETLPTVFSIVMFTVPGVILGGQIGSRIARRIPQRGLEIGLAVIFIVVAGLTLGQVIL
jgi:uncharacterized membrane protein YfcA